MPKIEQKQKVVKEIEQKLQDASLVVFSDYRGTTVAEITDLEKQSAGARGSVPGYEKHLN